MSLKDIQPAVGDSVMTGRDDQVCQKRRRPSSNAAKNSKRKFSVFKDPERNSDVEFDDKSTNTEELAGDLRGSNIETDLCSESEPSNEYWKDLAESRREALESSLKENEELHCRVKELTDRVNELEDERSSCIELAERAEKLVEAVQGWTETQLNEDGAADDTPCTSLSDEVQL